MNMEICRQGRSGMGGGSGMDEFGILAHLTPRADGMPCYYNSMDGSFERVINSAVAGMNASLIWC